MVQENPHCLIFWPARENPDEGSLSIKRDLKIAYLQQSPVLNDSNKIIDELFSTDSELVRVIQGI